MPDEMIDADWLCELFGLISPNPAVIGDTAHLKLRAFERAVDDARIVGRIKRYVVRDPVSRTVVGFCYKRRDVQTIMERGA